jgi:MFS family permease
MKEKRGIHDVKLLSGSSFFNEIGSEMVAPILPFYILALGGGGLAIGLLSGLKEGFSSFCRLFGGWLSDRLGKRKEVILFGYFISVIFKFLLGVAGSWQQLIAFVSFERFGKVRTAPRDAMISTAKRNRGRNFGIHGMMDALGGFFGAIFVLFLYWKFHLDFKLIILFAAGISFFALLTLKQVKEQRVKPIKDSIIKGIKNLDKKLKHSIFIMGFFSLANFGLYMFLLLRIKELTGSIALALFFYVLFNLVFAVFAIPFGRMSDKFGRKQFLFLGYALFVIVCLGFLVFENVLILGLLFVLYGLVYALIDSSQRAFVADLAGEFRGTAHGFYYLVLGSAGIIGGAVAGILWNVSPQLMFGYLAFMALIPIVLLKTIKN